MSDVKKPRFWTDRICDTSLTLAGWLCLALVLLTTEQVIARYFFNGSSVAAQELEWHIFGAIFLLAAAPALLHGEHVRVDIFYSRFSRRTQGRIDLAGHLLFLLPTCLILIWFGSKAALQARGYGNQGAQEQTLFELFFAGESSPDPGGLSARWLIKALIPTCGLLLLLAGSGELVRLIFERRINGGKD